jgi:hypothetical protein
MRNYDGAGFTPADDRAVNVLHADDVVTPIRIKYIGTAESGTVQVASGNILFKVGVVGSESADTTIQAGATPGTIDVTDAAGDTMGEVVDLINASAGWEAVLIDSTRAQDSGAAANKLLTKAATQAKVPDGITLNFDTNVALVSVIAILPPGLRNSTSPYKKGDGSIDAFFPLAQTEGVIDYVSSLSTFGAGTSIVTFVAEDSAGNLTTLFSYASGATTVQLDKDLSKTPFRGPMGQRLLVQLTNSSAMATTLLSANGSLRRALQ